MREMNFVLSSVIHITLTTNMHAPPPRMQWSLWQATRQKRTKWSHQMDIFSPCTGWSGIEIDKYWRIILESADLYPCWYCPSGQCIVIKDCGEWTSCVHAARSRGQLIRLVSECFWGFPELHPRRCEDPHHHHQRSQPQGNISYIMILPTRVLAGPDHGAPAFRLAAEVIWT